MPSSSSIVVVFGLDPCERTPRPPPPVADHWARLKAADVRALESLERSSTGGETTRWLMEMREA